MMIIDEQFLRAAVETAVKNGGVSAAAERLGVSRATMWRIRNGEGAAGSLTISSLGNIAKGLGVPPDRLILMEQSGGSSTSADELLSALVEALRAEGKSERAIKALVAHIENSMVMLAIRDEGWPGIAIAKKAKL